MQNVVESWAIDRWRAEQVAYSPNELAGNHDGTGRQLDDALVLWTNGLAKASSHFGSFGDGALAGLVA